MKDQEEQAFPIIDLNYINQKYSASVTSDMSVDDPNLKELSEKLSSALIKWGFAYLINHGINDEYIASSFEQSTRFFELDRHTKEKFLRTKDGENWGYVPFNVETFEKERPFDLKECFNFLPTSEKYDDITNVLPDFMQIESRFFNVCHDLTMKLIYLLNMALPVNDAYFLSNQHKYISNAKGNPTISRLLYYPPLKSHEEIQNHQLRCGEHSDYGTLTLLFQDDAGGLQVWFSTSNFSSSYVQENIVTLGQNVLKLVF